MPPSSCDYGLTFRGETEFELVPIEAQSGHFPTAYKFPPAGLRVSKDFALEKYKNLAYVMVIDAGRRKILPKAGMVGWWEENIWITSNPHPTRIVPGYDRYADSIDQSASLPGLRSDKHEIDKFFQNSIEKMGIFERTKIISQDEFEPIIRAAEEKRRSPDKDRMNQLEQELAALKKRNDIGDEEYMSRQRVIVAELIEIGKTISEPEPFFTNPAAFFDVQDHYGNHLILGFLARLKGRRFEVDLKILDPVDRDIVFHAHSEAYWLRKGRPGWDQCVIYPLFNAFIDWSTKSAIILQ